MGSGRSPADRGSPSEAARTSGRIRYHRTHLTARSRGHAMGIRSFVWVALLAGPAVAAPPDGTTVRVLTYNVHHGEGTDGKVDLPRIAAVIKAADPDLVALQEVDNKCRRSGKVDQTAELAK